MSIKGYKGLDKNFKCQNFQFEVGKEYEEKEIVLCKRGFHFCINPFDVFRYYRPSISRFAEVEGDDKTNSLIGNGKVVCTKIKIQSELGLKDLIEAGMEFIFKKVEWNKEDTPQTHGDYSAAQAHGDYSAASALGERSVAVSTGVSGKARGKKGCWLTLAEWKNDGNYNWTIETVQSVRVDGESIKENTFYTLRNGKFIAIEREEVNG